MINKFPRLNYSLIERGDTLNKKIEQYEKNCYWPANCAKSLKLGKVMK